MKKLVVFLFVIGVSTQLFAEIKTKDVVGKWKYTVVTDQGDMTGNLVFKENEGILTISPLTKICLCKTNCLAPRLVGEMPSLKTTLSNLDSNNCSNTSPVIPPLRDALWNKFAN